MDYRKAFLVKPGSKVRLAKIDPGFAGAHELRDIAQLETRVHVERMGKLQYRLYANGRRSLLIVLQALDAAGKDGTIRRLFTGMNPQGVRVFGFRQPSAEEAAHDFLWRAHARTPARGEVAIFNRSHYEDVLVVRVHKWVDKSVWSKRYALINDFEKLLTDNGTKILKFYLHISPAEQLRRFGERLAEPASRWKISTSDYTERALWPAYVEAYEDALRETSTRHAPWYVIPANQKWFRDLAISQIVADTLDEMGLELPPVRVDLDEIRRRYHAALQAPQPGKEPTERPGTRRAGKRPPTAGPT